MLISCKACAAVNFIQYNPAKPRQTHCTICRKVLDLSAPIDDDKPHQAFRVGPQTAPAEVAKPEPVSERSFGAIGELLDESCETISDAPMWVLSGLNSKQRLSLTSASDAEHEYVHIDSIEDEEEELIDSKSHLRLPAIDLAQWNAINLPSAPAADRRARLNQRLTLAAWMFVVGVGTAGAASAAVKHTTTPPSKKTATAALAEISPPIARAAIAKQDDTSRRR
jgi:hypothetical protein